MLKTKTTTVPTVSRPSLASLNLAPNYSLKNTNNKPFRTSTFLNILANPSQTLYQPHNEPNKGLSAGLPSSFLVPTVNLMTPSSLITRTFSVPFVAEKRSVKPFDGLDHQKSREENLQQIDEHMVFTMGRNPLDRVAYNQLGKQMAYKQCFLSGFVLSRFLLLHEIYKTDWSAFVSAWKDFFFHRKLHITLLSKLKF